MEVAAQRHKSFWAARCVGDFYVSPIDQTLSVSSAVVRMGGKACEHVFDEAVAFAGSETHVLVVDDSIVDRKIIERLLKTDTVKVTTVDSPIRALEILRLSQEQTMTPTCKNFSMVITDYCMPEMTGYDLLKKLKEIKGLKEIPVVIMSSENVPQRIQRCLDEGAKEFIMKPVQREDVKKIKRHIIQLQSQSTHAAEYTTTVSVSTKRKLSSANLAGETNERRPRFSGSVRVP